MPAVMAVKDCVNLGFNAGHFGQEQLGVSKRGGVIRQDRRPIMVSR
jgi:hypothetical protein